MNDLDVTILVLVLLIGVCAGWYVIEWVIQFYNRIQEAKKDGA